MVIVINSFSLPLISRDRSLILGISIFVNSIAYGHEVGVARLNNVGFLATAQVMILCFKRVTHSHFGCLFGGRVQYPGQYCSPVVQFLTLTPDFIASRLHATERGSLCPTAGRTEGSFCMDNCSVTEEEAAVCLFQNIPREISLYLLVI
jgi:hypothetical protein